jgi:hypothetical protein
VSWPGRQAFKLEPLPREGRLAECCSWGGQIAATNPRYTRHLVEQRVQAGPHPYLTYCVNCRDVFASAGKPAWHVLDLMLGSTCRTGLRRPRPGEG